MSNKIDPIAEFETDKEYLKQLIQYHREYVDFWMNMKKESDSIFKRDSADNMIRSHQAQLEELEVLLAKVVKM